MDPTVFMYISVYLLFAACMKTSDMKVFTVRSFPESDEWMAVSLCVLLVPFRYILEEEHGLCFSSIITSYTELYYFLPYFRNVTDTIEGNHGSKRQWEKMEMGLPGWCVCQVQGKWQKHQCAVWPVQKMIPESSELVLFLSWQETQAVRIVPAHTYTRKWGERKVPAWDLSV